MEHPKFCVYILYSLKDDIFYIGYTVNFERHMQEHAQGKPKSTALRRPFIVMMCEHFMSKEDALRRETYFKSTKGRRSLIIMLHRALCQQMNSYAMDMQIEIL